MHFFHKGGGGPGKREARTQSAHWWEQALFPASALGLGRPNTRFPEENAGMFIAQQALPCSLEHLPVFPTWQPQKPEQWLLFSSYNNAVEFIRDPFCIFQWVQNCMLFPSHKSYHVLYSFKNQWSGLLAQVELLWWERKKLLLESYLSEVRNKYIF